jgi:hypothetical protein
MNKDKDIISWIDGELNDEELTQVKNLCDDHPELKEDKRIYEKIIEYVKTSEENKLKKNLDEYLKNYLKEAVPNKNQIGIKKPLTYLSIAASIAILIFCIKFYAPEGNEIILEKIETPVKLDSAIYKKDSLDIRKKEIE